MSTTERLTDVAWLEAALRRTPNRWVTGSDLLRMSFRERDCGLTVHSRAADLRRRLRGAGEDVACSRLHTEPRAARPVYAYKLVTTAPGTAVVMDGGEQMPLDIDGGAS